MKARLHWRTALFAVATSAALGGPCVHAAPRTVTLMGDPTTTTNAPGQRSGMIYSVAFAPDGKTLASGNDNGRVSLWDTATDKQKTTLTGHTAYVKTLSWSPQSTLLLSAGQTFNKDGSLSGSELKIWDVAQGKPRFELSWPDYYVDLTAWSPVGDLIAIAGTKSQNNKSFPQIEIRDANSGQLLKTMIPVRGNKSINRLLFSPDGKLLLSLIHWDCNGHLWDAASGQVVRELQPAPQLKIPFADDSFAFSPDSKTLARGRGDGSILLEEARSGKEIRTIGKTGPLDLFSAVKIISFSADGKTLRGVCSFEIKTWNAENGESLSRTRRDVTGDAVLSTDGNLLAGYANRSLFLSHLTP